MSANPWQESLKQAEEEYSNAWLELNRAKERVVELEDRVNALQEAKEAIGRLCVTQAADADPGLKDTCLGILRDAKRPLAVPELRDEMVAGGFRKNYRNILAVLHTTLKRLEKTGDVIAVGGVDGQTKYEATVPF
jgi:hypothetical protein